MGPALKEFHPSREKREAQRNPKYTHATWSGCHLWCIDQGSGRWPEEGTGYIFPGMGSSLLLLPPEVQSLWPTLEVSPCPCSQLLETLTLPGLVPAPLPARICCQISRLSACSLLMISNSHRPIWQTMKKGSQRTRSSLTAELVTPARQEKHSLLKVSLFSFQSLYYFWSILRQISQEGPRVNLLIYYWPWHLTQR